MDWPAEVVTIVDNGLQSFSAELILRTDEEINANDGEYSEDEALENHHIEQAGY